MKKASVLIVSAVMSLSMLCACTGSELSSGDKSSSTTTKETTTTTAETTTTTTTTTEETTTTTTEETTTTTTEQTTTTTTSQTEAVATGKATGDRPNIKAKANLYVCRDFTQGAPVDKHIIASTDYDQFCTSPVDPIATTKEIQGNDFMDSLDKKCSNGKWERVPEKDDGSSLAYRFTGTTKGTSVQYRNFVILVNVWKDGRFVGNFSNDKEILDEYNLFGYIFTN